jgi:hypothetical protein
MYESLFHIVDSDGEYDSGYLLNYFSFGNILK